MCDVCVLVHLFFLLRMTSNSSMCVIHTYTHKSDIERDREIEREGGR